MAFSTFRLRGAYVVVVTLAIAMTVYQLAGYGCGLFPADTNRMLFVQSGGARGL